MRPFIVTFAAGMLLFSWAPVKAAEGEKTEKAAEELFEKKCSICHSIERPKGKRKAQEEWEATVTRMRNVNGCPLTEEEARTIIEYLGTHYAK